MVKQSGMFLFIQWVIVAGLIGTLALGGCSKKNVLATSTGAEGKETMSKAKTSGGMKSEDGRRTDAGGSGLEPAPGEPRSGSAGTTDKLSGMPGGDGPQGEGSGGREAPGGRSDSALKSEQIAKSDARPKGLSPDGGAEPGPPGRSTESLGPIGSGPLQGFNKGPEEERLGETPPMMITKAEPQDIERRKERDERRRELADIYFAFDKWALSIEGKKNLAESAEFLRQNPDVKLVIEGYCDERGSREYNLVLGEKRAKETRRFLADLGILNPVSVTSYGKERQVCAERDESCYWKNRRAHLVIDAEK
jgi:peptidoglycan-associated lipoprotein